MNKEHFSKAAEAELKLNNALVNANISDGYEQYLALFDHFYDENVEVVGASNPDPLVGKSRVLPVISNFLMPLHVMAEIGGLSVGLRHSNDRACPRTSMWRDATPGVRIAAPLPHLDAPGPGAGAAAGAVNSAGIGKLPS